MPFLRAFVAGGVRAPLRSVVPAADAAGLDIADDGQAAGTPRRLRLSSRKRPPTAATFRFTVSQDIRSPTIWSLASDEGRRVSALNFPADVPGARGQRLRRAGRLDALEAAPARLPPGGALRPPEGPARSSTPRAGHGHGERGEGARGFSVGGGVRRLDRAAHAAASSNWFEILDFLMREEPADLTAVLFDGVDKLQHLLLAVPSTRRAGGPTRPPGSERSRRSARTTSRRLDGYPLADRRGRRPPRRPS